MTASDASELVHLDHERRRPPRDCRETLRPESIARPAALLAVVVEHDPVGVAADQPNRLIEAAEPIEAFGWECAGDDVAEHNDLVSRRAAWVDKHGVERLHIPVYVREHRELHKSEPTLQRAAPSGDIPEHRPRRKVFTSALIRWPRSERSADFPFVAEGVNESSEFPAVLLGHG